MHFADLDGDGNQDLVVKRVHKASEFGVHYGDGTGAIGPFISVETGTSTYEVLSPDLNLDGLLDLVRCGPTSSAYLNTPGGYVPFTQGMWNSITGLVFAVQDIDLDGNQDIVECTSGQTLVHYCDSSFNLLQTELAASVSLDAGLRWPTVTDFDGDGLPDLLGSDGAQLWLIQGGPGAFVATAITSSSTPIGFAPIDYDGDGDLDLATVHGTSGFAVVESIAGVLGPVHTYTTAVSWIQSVATQDYDLDGIQDLVLYGHTSGIEFRRNCSSQDCNGNGIPDDQDLSNGTSNDCDSNGRPDECDLAADPSLDWNGDGILDACSSPNYCTANPNTTGQSAFMSATGSPLISDNNFTLSSNQMPPFEWGYFLMANSQGFVPNVGGSSGNLCLGGPVYRFNKFPTGQVLSSGAGGTFSFGVNLTDLPQGVVFQLGETWNFQAWFRDGSASTSNFTDGIEVMFR